MDLAEARCDFCGNGDPDAPYIQNCPKCGPERGTDMKYRKKPVVVEARGPIEHSEDIVTLEGVMRADVGDYIITGVQGEQYPCKPDIFHATYEPAEPENVEEP